MDINLISCCSFKIKKNLDLHFLNNLKKSTIWPLLSVTKKIKNNLYSPLHIGKIYFQLDYTSTWWWAQLSFNIKTLTTHLCYNTLFRSSILLGQLIWIFTINTINFEWLRSQLQYQLFTGRERNWPFIIRFYNVLN